MSIVFDMSHRSEGFGDDHATPGRRRNTSLLPTSDFARVAACIGRPLTAKYLRRVHSVNGDRHLEMSLHVYGVKAIMVCRFAPYVVPSRAPGSKDRLSTSPFPNVKMDGWYVDLGPSDADAVPRLGHQRAMRDWLSKPDDSVPRWMS